MFRPLLAALALTLVTALPAQAQTTATVKTTDVPTTTTAVAKTADGGTVVQTTTTSGGSETTTTTTDSSATTQGSPVSTATPDKLILDTTKGRVVIALRPDLAPQHVARVKELASNGFYDGVIFHRVIAGFMAQTGDPTGTGTGGSKLPDLKAEFTPTPYVRGTVGAARTGNPNSANSQFFITFGDASFLNGQYTVWGQVVEGMDVVDQINKGEPPANPDKITKATIESATAAAAPAAAAQ